MSKTGEDHIADMFDMLSEKMRDINYRLELRGSLVFTIDEMNKVIIIADSTYKPEKEQK